MSHIFNIVEGFMQQTRAELVENYDRLGLRASGTFEKELQPEITERPDGVTAVMKSVNYVEFMQSGRRPNKNPSPAAAKKLYPAITQWVQDKGLNFPKSRIFAICLKIVYKGIEVPNAYNKGGLVSDVLTEEKKLALLREVGQNLVFDFKVNIRNVLTKQ